MKGAPSDYAFLTACLVGCPHADLSCQGGSLQSSAAWESIIRTASNEAILPALHDCMRESGMLGDLPPEIAGFLETVADSNRQRNVQILSELKEVVQLLNLHGIEPVALKGVAFLLSGAYKDSASRYLWDIDLLIPDFQLQLAIETLERAGYRQDKTDALARFRHHVPQLRREGCAPIELHHSLALGPPGRLLPPEEVLRDSTAIEWDGTRIRIPAPEHLLGHLIVHSQFFHYNERVHPTLRTMYDLWLLYLRWGTLLDWHKVNQRFRSAGYQTTLWLYLLHAEETLPFERPYPFRISGLVKLRWIRRRLLNRFPILRYVDPSYLLLATLYRRFHLLRSILSVPGGWKEACRVLLELHFYRRMFAEIILR